MADTRRTDQSATPASCNLLTTFHCFKIMRKLFEHNYEVSLHNYVWLLLYLKK